MECKEKILSEDYFDVITDYPLASGWEQAYDLCALDVDNRYYMLYVNRGNVGEENDYFYSYRSLPKLYGLMQEELDNGEENGFDPNSLIVSGILQVQRAPLELTGRGCVIVLIDTGIDYTDELFRNEDGTTRILAIWDQTIQTGNPPEGIPFGSVYTREQINRALAAEDPYQIVPSRDELRHGSNLAAIAAGSRLNDGRDYVGAACDANLVVIKLKQCKKYLRDFYLIGENVPAYQENDIMLAVQYGNRFARQFRRPAVFCIGLGTNNGNHAGSSALSEYLDSIAVMRSRAVVVCGGNEGNAGHHFQGQVPTTGRNGERNSGESVEVKVGQNAAGFLMQLWGNVPDIFTIAVRTPGGETIPPIRLGIQDAITYSFVYESSRITVAGELVEPASGEELITLRVINPTPGIWTFTVAASSAVYNGEFHMWLPISEFLDTEVYFLRASPYITLTEPATARDVITVATYDAANNSLYFRSGRGFSRDGMICPDFAAPGVDLTGIRGTYTGSSYAAALTAGAVAQFMQWAVVDGNNTEVESREIRNYFIRGASRDYGLLYPNREWGYGRLNMVGTFDALIGV